MAQQRRFKKKKGQKEGKSGLGEIHYTSIPIIKWKFYSFIFINAALYWDRFKRWNTDDEELNRIRVRFYREYDVDAATNAYAHNIKQMHGTIWYSTTIGYNF